MSILNPGNEHEFGARKDVYEADATTCRKAAGWYRKSQWMFLLFAFILLLNKVSKQEISLINVGIEAFTSILVLAFFELSRRYQLWRAGKYDILAENKRKSVEKARQEIMEGLDVDGARERQAQAEKYLGFFERLWSYAKKIFCLTIVYLILDTIGWDRIWWVIQAGFSLIKSFVSSPT